MERLDEGPHKTPSMESIKRNQTKLLHGLEGSLNSAPFERDGNLYDFFPRAKSPLHEDLSLQEEDKDIPHSKEDQDLRSPFEDEAFSTM